MPVTKKPVLIVGGSGFVGTQAAKTLRKLHPQLPIAIGGRNLVKANAVASGIGNATAVAIDLERPDLGQPAEAAAYSAVVMFVYDDTLNALQYALANGLPYLSFSSSIHEIGPEVARFAHRPAAPILMGSSWLAGTTSIATAHFAKEFRSVTAIEITALFDEQDMGGPAAEADFTRLTLMSHTMFLDKGSWRWTSASEPGRTFKSIDGREIVAQTYSPFDVFSLPVTTGARSVRFDFAFAKPGAAAAASPSPPSSSSKSRANVRMEPLAETAMNSSTRRSGSGHCARRRAGGGTACRAERRGSRPRDSIFRKCWSIRIMPCSASGNSGCGFQAPKT